MSRFRKSFLDAPSGAKLRLYTRDAGKKARGVVHVNHGMSEHSARYARFAEVLAKAGYHTVAHDHRGHGETTAADTQLGQFALKDGWTKTMDDVDAVNAHIRDTYPDLPVCIFGHSMGSIIGLNYCIHHSDRVDAAGIWNSGADAGLLLVIYKLLLGIERMFKGSDVPSQIARKLTFEDWNKKFAPNRTESDWLSRDPDEVDKYIADPLCGFDATNSLWRDLSIGISENADDALLGRIRKDLPIHLVAGAMDPCTNNGKAVERVYGRLQKLGMQDVECNILPDTRHESLNEINRDQTTADFIAWLDARFGK